MSATSKRPAPKRAQRVVEWRSRIVGHGEERADKLLANPGNWRIHPTAQQRALGALLDRVGWVQDVVVNRTTGHVVDGHLRVSLALGRNEKVPIVYVELKPEEEKLVLATMDPVTGMGVADDAKLGLLLRGFEAEGPIAELLAEINEGLAPLAPRQDAGPEQTRNLGDPKHQVKAVLYVNEIEVVEQALAKTGERDRGSALLAICRAYLAQ